MEEIELIQQLSDAFGPSGNEDDVVSFLKAELQARATLKENHVRDLFVEFKKNSHRRVMLDSHLDEVGIMVQAIRPNGMIEFITLGGWQNNTLPGSRIQIRNSVGQMVNGIVSSIPPHYLPNHGSGSETSVADMTIDVGATSDKEVKEVYHIGIGAFGAPAVSCQYDDRSRIFTGKAFDCRVGVAAMTTVFKDINPDQLNVELCGAYTAQEEVGERGATSAYEAMKPDLVICFEGCPADDTFASDYKIQTGLKRGPMLRYMDRSVICSPRFMKFTLDVARQVGVPVQEAVRSGGGVNAAVYEQHGVPSIVIGIPVRYIHSPLCYTCYDDYINAVKLAKAILSNLTDEIIDSF